MARNELLVTWGELAWSTMGNLMKYDHHWSVSWRTNSCHFYFRVLNYSSQIAQQFRPPSLFPLSLWGKLPSSHYGEKRGSDSSISSVECLLHFWLFFSTRASGTQEFKLRFAECAAKTLRFAAKRELTHNSTERGDGRTNLKPTSP